MRAYLGPIGFLVVFFAYPLAWTLGAAFDAPAWQWVAGDYARSRILGAAGQATLSVLATFALAIPLAWHHHTRALPWSRVHLAIHAAPFILPVFVVVGGLREWFGSSGWIAQWTGLDVLGWLGPLGAVVLAHAYYNYGFAARLLHSTLERRPHRMEATAQLLGATPRQAFWRVTVPLLVPAFASTALLVWLFSFTSFGVVLFLGQGQIATPETLIYQNLGGAFPQASRAAALGVVQLALNVALLSGYFALQRRAQQLPQDPPHNLPSATRRDRFASQAALAVGLAPVLAVLVGGFRVRGVWSMEAWGALLDPSHPAHLAGFELFPVVARSLVYAITSAALALALTITLGYSLARAGKLRRLAELFASIPLGTSSILLGLGYLLAFGAGSWLDLRGALVAIIIVHSLVAFPFVARILLPAMDQHDARMDDAAALLGAPPLHVMTRIQWPLLRGPLVAAAGFAAAISLGDFGATLLLARRDTMSLAVWIGEHDQPFRSILHAQSIALTAILMVLAASAYLVAERWRTKEVW